MCLFRTTVSVSNQEAPAPTLTTPCSAHNCCISVAVWNQFWNTSFNFGCLSAWHSTCSAARRWGSVVICRSQNGVRRSQWPRGLRRVSAAARLLRLWIRIPPGTWMSVCCECCVLSGRGLYDGLFTRPEASYQQWCVVECDLETPWMRRPWTTGGCHAK